jgi:hypothetical protein
VFVDPVIHVSIPIFRGIHILKQFGVVHGPKLEIEGIYNFDHLPDIAIQRNGECCEAAAPVDRGQGLEALIRAFRHQAVNLFLQFLCPQAEAYQKIGGEGRQIAGNDQIPFGVGVEERGLHASQRTATGPKVGNHGVSKALVLLGISDQRHTAGGFLDRLGYPFHQSNAAGTQERFIGSHPRAVSARQDVTGYAHAEMIASKLVLIRPIHAILALLMTLVPCPALLSAEEAAATRTTLVVRADARSGRLVRSVVVAPRVVTPQPVNQPEPAETPAATGSLSEMIDSIAAKHEVEGPLVHSVIKAESNYNPLAVSPKGAQGLMQLIPSTARRFGVANTFNPEQNIEGGVKYLKFLMELYHNDYVKVIAAYNAGEGAVTKYGGIPPYAETRSYVYQVGRNLQTARKADERKKAAAKIAEATPPTAGGEQFHPIQAVTGPDGKLYYRTQ